MMTPSTNEINTQSVSTSVLVNQQPQSYYVYEDTRTQGLLCIPSFMMIFILPAWLLYLAICSFVQYNQFIEKTSEFSKKLWHKRELNYRLPIDFSKQAAIV
ncbi:unnamed protein product [Rotaria socialis]